MSKKILLENREDLYQGLQKIYEAAEASLKPLISYCEETLQIEVTNLKEFFSDPKKYCIDAYWEKYGEQFKNSPVQKEKLFTLTAWNDNTAEVLIQEAKRAFAALGPRYYEMDAEGVKFKADPEAFKVYLKEEDEDLYRLTEEFIEVANKMEARGGKPAWYLARYYGTLGVEGIKGEILVPSKSFFKSDSKSRKYAIGGFMK